MIHPRVSLHSACSLQNDFAADLVLWETLGVSRVGVSDVKIARHGRDAATRELKARGLQVTSVLTGWFDLADPHSWPARRGALRTALDTALEIGAPVVYTTPGASDGRSWETLLETFSDAVGPCLDHAPGAVELVIEPSARTQVSFVNTLRDAAVLGERLGIGIVVDFGNAWAERDYATAVAGLGERLALVQVADVRVGAFSLEDSATASAPVGRVVPGDGDLELARLLQPALDMGYEGPFEIEVMGPAIESEGYASAARRSLSVTSELLTSLGV